MPSGRCEIDIKVLYASLLHQPVFVSLGGSTQQEQGRPIGVWRENKGFVAPRSAFVTHILDI